MTDQQLRQIINLFNEVKKQNEDLRNDFNTLSSRLDSYCDQTNSNTVSVSNAINTAADHVINSINTTIFNDLSSVVNDLNLTSQSLTMTDIGIADKMIKIDKMIIDFISEVGNIIDTKGSDICNSINESYVNGCNVLQASIIQFKTQYEQLIETNLNIRQTIVELITQLTATTDAYMSGIKGFTNAAMSTMEITQSLSEATGNLKQTGDIVIEKVNDVKENMQKLNELSLLFIQAVERKVKGVDISEMVENITNSLVNTKFILSKKGGKDL